MSTEVGVEIPEGLYDLLKDVTLAVLRERPANLYTFVAEHFVKVSEQHKAQNVPMYVVVNDDKLAAEPEPGSLRLRSNSKRYQQIRSGRRGSVSAERYDPEKDVSMSGRGATGPGCGAASGPASGARGDLTGCDGATSSDNSTQQDPVVVHPKTPEQRRRLAEAVRDILLFRSLEPEVMSDVIDAMFERHVVPGDYVIRQGDDGDNFYVIDSGSYDVVISSGTDDDRKATRVLQFDGHGSFGELALMYNQPRAASVIAVTEGQLWAMDRTSFRRLVLHSAFRKRQLYDRMLRGVPMLSALDDYERATLADALQSITFVDGQLIVAEGDVHAEGMYFIERGAARVTITKNGCETEVSRLEAGSYFGEMALLENSARTASVYAMSPSTRTDDEKTVASAVATAVVLDAIVSDGEHEKKPSIEITSAARTNEEMSAATILPTERLESSGSGLIKVAFLERESFERLLGPCLDVLKRNTASYKKSSP